MFSQVGYLFKKSGFLEGALGHDLRDARLLNLDLGVVRDLDDCVVFANARDATEYSAGGQDLVTHAQISDELGVRFLFLLLRPNEEKIKCAEDDGHGQ